MLQIQWHSVTLSTLTCRRDTTEPHRLFVLCTHKCTLYTSIQYIIVFTAVWDVYGHISYGKNLLETGGVWFDGSNGSRTSAGWLARLLMFWIFLLHRMVQMLQSLAVLCQFFCSWLLSFIASLSSQVAKPRCHTASLSYAKSLETRQKIQSLLCLLEDERPCEGVWDTMKSTAIYSLNR